MKKAKRLLTFLLAFVLVGTLWGCGSSEDSKSSTDSEGTSDSESSSDYVFKIGTSNGALCMAPVHIALDNGYLDEEFEAAGISYETVEVELAEASDFAASGKIDACVGLAAGLIPQIDNGLEISFTGGLHTGCIKYYVKEDSGINGLEDLKGKKIGVPGIADTSVIFLKRKLNDLGIGVSTDNMEVELVSYALTDLPLALENGAVDAVALHEPVAYQAEQEYGFQKILDLAEDEKFSNEYCCQIYVSNEAIEQYPEAAAAYTRALLKAAAFIQANPAEAAQLQLDNNQVDGDVAVHEALLSSFNYTPSVSVAKDTFYATTEELISIGDLSEDIDLDSFTEEHFKVLDGVPDSYEYHDGTFTEIN